MTELERARQNLFDAQFCLYWCRTHGAANSVLGEDRVLAALSWLWDAQERADRDMVWSCRDGRRLTVRDMSTSHIHNSLNLISTHPWWRKEFRHPLERELQRRK